MALTHRNQISAYTFAPSTKKITLTGMSTVDLSCVISIVNTTRAYTYYKVGDPSLLATVSTNVITLNANVDTTGHAATDAIHIAYVEKDTTTPNLGQAAASGSIPVVLTADQITALTPPKQITDFALEATLAEVKDNTDNLDVALSTRLKAGDTLTGVKTVETVTTVGTVNIVSEVAKIADPLPAGSNVIGQFGIDQKTPGTTNRVHIGDDGEVTIKASADLNTSKLALEAGGNLEVLAGKTSATAFFSTRVSNGTAFIDPTQIRALTAADIVSLGAGTNLVGKFGIDQTTPGTTNKVDIGDNGKVIANAGTDLNTSKLALEAGGNLEVLAGKTSATSFLANRITNGTAFVDPTQIRALTASDIVSLGAGTNTIGNTNQTLTTAEFAKITDGTNTAAVKAASVVAVAADPALVVQISPNLPTAGLSTNIVSVGGNAIATNNGAASTGTIRVIQANRTETLTGSIGTTADLVVPANQRIRCLTFTNNTTSIIYLQIHNKATALVNGDVPLNGLIIRVPINSTVDKTVADYGDAGILYGANVHIGLSSTFATFTAITPTNTSINVITVA